MQRRVTAHAPDYRPIAPKKASLADDLPPLLLAGGVSLLLGIPMLLFPFGPDQAIFAYIAHRMSLGGFPYVSAWDQKPPAIYVLYLIGIHFPGPLMRDLRLFDLCMLGLTILALFLLGRLLWDRWTGGLAGLLYGVAYTTEYGYWHTAQPDGYTGLPLALSLWLYYRSLRRKSWLPYLLAGALTGFAFQLRFFSALIGLVLLYIEWHVHRFGSLPARLAAIRRISWFSAGFALMQCLFAAYLMAGHALGQYLYTEFRFSTAYAHLGGPYSPDGFRWNLYLYAARDATEYFFATHTLVTAPAVAATIWALRRGGDDRVREIAVAALAAYLGVLIQAKFFLYHWLAVLPFAALLGGAGLSLIWRALVTNRRAIAAVPGLTALVMLLLVLSPQVTDHAIQQWQGVRQYYAGPVARSAFNNQFGPYAGGTFSYLADDQVARYVAARTDPHDTIYVYGYEALVYLIAGRESASRFFYVFPVISTWSPTAWQTEFYSDLAARHPRYILIQANEGAPWITGLHEDTAHYAAHDAALQQLLRERYTLETQIEDFTLYRLTN